MISVKRLFLQSHFRKTGYLFTGAATHTDMNDLVKLLHAEFQRTDLPVFKAGDTVNVHVKIREGNKERVQQYQGVVIQRRGSGATETMTVRKISNGVGVERVFPIHSPTLDKIEVTKQGRVRRARIYYLRGLSGKAARISERKAALVPVENTDTTK